MNDEYASVLRAKLRTHAIDCERAADPKTDFVIFADQLRDMVTVMREADAAILALTSPATQGAAVAWPERIVNEPGFFREVVIPDACPFGTWHDNMGRGWGDEETAKRMSVAEEPGEAFFDPSLYARGWNECREAFAMLNAAPSPATEQAGAEARTMEAVRAKLSPNEWAILCAGFQEHHAASPATEQAGADVECPPWHCTAFRHGPKCPTLLGDAHKPAPVGGDAVERVSDAMVERACMVAATAVHELTPAQSKQWRDYFDEATVHDFPVLMRAYLAAATQEGGA